MINFIIRLVLNAVCVHYETKEIIIDLDRTVFYINNVFRKSLVRYANN